MVRCEMEGEEATPYTRNIKEGYNIPVVVLPVPGGPCIMDTSLFAKQNEIASCCDLRIFLKRKDKKHDNMHGTECERKY